MNAKGREAVTSADATLRPFSGSEASAAFEPASIGRARGSGAIDPFAAATGSGPFAHCICGPGAGAAGESEATVTGRAFVSVFGFVAAAMLGAGCARTVAILLDPVATTAGYFAHQSGGKIAAGAALTSAY